MNGSTGGQPFSLSENIQGAIVSLLGDLDPGAWKTLCGEVKTLSTLFTLERHHLGKAYLNKSSQLKGYLAYYLPINIGNIQTVLHELPRLEDMSWPDERVIRILDVGAGPGTGALATLDWVHTHAGHQRWVVEATLLDHSPPALYQAKQLWKSYAARVENLNARFQAIHGDVEREIHSVLKNRKAGRRYDLIILANVLNELFLACDDSLDRKKRLVGFLVKLLSPDGSLVIVEPALRSLTRGLHQLRDLVLEDRTINVFSPCLHEHSCPALKKRDDWCYEERPWVPSPIVAAIDHTVGFSKETLKFSYVVLRKDGRTIIERRPSVFRVVSGVRELKGDTRVWVCNETGRYEVGRLHRARTALNQEFDTTRRGDIVGISETVRSEKRSGVNGVTRIVQTSHVHKRWEAAKGSSSC